MATNTSLVLGSVTQSGDKNQKTIIEVNGDTDSVILREFSEQLNGLTTNTFGEAVRVDKIGLDSIPGSVAPPATPTLTLSPTVVSSRANETIAPYCATCTVTYSGDGTLSASNKTTDTPNAAPVKFIKTDTDNVWEMRVFANNAGTVTVSAAATDAYESVSAVLTINY